MELERGPPIRLEWKISVQDTALAWFPDMIRKCVWAPLLLLLLLQLLLLLLLLRQ